MHFIFQNIIFIYFTFLFNNIHYISVFFLQFIPLKQSIKSTPTTISKNNNNKLSHQQEHNVLLKKKKKNIVRERDKIKNTKKKLYNLLRGVLFLRLIVASCIICYRDAFLDMGAFFRVLYILECILHLDDFALNMIFCFF